MRIRTDDWPCTIARSVDLLGEGWTLLVLRQAFLGCRRFDDFQAQLGIGRNILTIRLHRLVEEGLLEKVRYQDRPPRFEYHLTEMGRDVFPILVAYAAFGDRWLVGDEGTPLVLHHLSCSHDTTPTTTCSHCGDRLDAGNTWAFPGPGHPESGTATPTR